MGLRVMTTVRLNLTDSLLYSYPLISCPRDRRGFCVHDGGEQQAEREPISRDRLVDDTLVFDA